MIVMKTSVIAEAWIRVSRSGHWTRLSSAQQEMKNPITPPRWRFSTGAAAFGARRFSDSLARCLRSFSAWRWARRLILSTGRGLGGVGRAPTSARRRRRGLGRLVGLAGQLVERDAALGELGLDLVARLADLGVVLGARLLGELGVRAALLLLRLARAARPFAVLASSPRSERLARFLVRRVVAAPAAVLAHLDPVGRVSPRLVGLVVAPLALLAGEGYGDSNVSASHLLLS